MTLEIIAVAGGGVAAARAITALRRKGFVGRIVLIAAEEHLPYDRPPLSKNVLLGNRDATFLPFDPEQLGVDVWRGTRAVGLDTAAREIHTDRGHLAFDSLIVATGSDPMTLPGSGEQLTLRTLDDAIALRERLRPGASVLVIGASWIGAEIATAALSSRSSVICLEAGPGPLAKVLGEEVSRLLLPWWAEVDLRVRTAVDEVSEQGVRLRCGTAIPADVVVTGVGVRPSIGWLRGSGLHLDRGVLVDEYLRTNVPGILAVGDVAQRYSPRAKEHIVVEHWDDAGRAAVAAAANLLAEHPERLIAHDPVPFFWSEQFGHQVQYVGHHRHTDQVEIEDPADGTPVVRWWSADGVLTAWLGVDRPRETMRARQEVGHRRGGEVPTPPHPGTPP